jgi:hypothetical protein
MENQAKTKQQRQHYGATSTRPRNNQTRTWNTTLRQDRIAIHHCWREDVITAMERVDAERSNVEPTLREAAPKKNSYPDKP